MEKSFPRTTGYGHRPASSTSTIRSSGASSSSRKIAARSDYAIPEDEYRKWELRKCYYAEQILLDTKGSFSNDLNELKETLKAYAPNEANVSLRGDLPITVETTSRTFLLSCPSADDAYVLLLHSNGKVECVLKGSAAV